MPRMWKWVFVKKEKAVSRYCLFGGMLGFLFLLGIFEENPGEKIHIPLYFAAGILVFVSMKKKRIYRLAYDLPYGRNNLSGAGLDVDVLAAGHHGSKNTSSRAFLESISPGHVIIPVSKDNISGYPHPETVERIKKFSEKVSMTWREGDVRLEIGRGDTGR